jgi:hypothetical protein
LHVGQIIRYRIGYRAATSTNTESTVVAPMAPTGGQTNASIILQVEVEDTRLEAGRPLVRLRTRILEPDLAASPSGASANGAQDSNGAGDSANRGKVVELTLQSDGKVADVQGLEKLSADERAAWQEWVERFGGGAALPEKGVKAGEKWKTEEPISNALLAGLSWEKESQYVNDTPCSAMNITPKGELAPAPQAQETCAVILTTATLKQKSSPKDATPEDYMLHDLRTAGTAQGTNEIITYISLKTGLVVRATEDANQSMSVTVATSNGSNRVQYTIAAESHARVLLLADAPDNHP